MFGIIIRPANFDPAKKYPVIEDIYAGPHDSFVPKSFRTYYKMQRLAELGFIVVKVDAERNLLFVRGAIPGARNGIVTVAKQGGPSRHD